MSGLSSSRINLDNQSGQKHMIAVFDNDNQCNISLTNKVGFEILL